MNAEEKAVREFQFYLRDVDTHLKVTTGGNEVLVRATRDRVSQRRKTFFVRELAAEGFLPDAYAAYVQEKAGDSLPVVWVVDRSWEEFSSGPLNGTNRFMFRLLAWGCLLWCVLLALLLAGALTKA